jgi:gas vesicle protein
METSQSSGGAASQAQEKAQDVAGQAQEKAQQVAGQARGQLRDQVDQRSTQAGEQIRSQASDVRTVAQQLREQGKEGPAKLADQAADRAERLGGYLRESDADRILSDVEDFARRQPMAVLLGGLAVGFAASRVLKASSRDRYESRSAGTSRDAGGRYGLASGAYRAGDEQRTAHLEPRLEPPPPPARPIGDPTVSPTGGVIR